MSDSFHGLFEAQDAHFRERGAADPAHRKDRLTALKDELMRRGDDIRAALDADFRKPAAEVDATEIAPVIIEINHALRHLDEWMKPRRLPSPSFMAGTRSVEHVEPKGPSMIMSPWNYVVNLTLGPFASAIAAGCPVILKPSEHTPHTSVLIDTIVSSLFPPEEAVVVQGDATVAKRLLELPFRHIHFTGSPAVGRIVMRAAADHLASVTLELGGKSPAYVDESADARESADRIAFGKWTNAGQTCIAPDYVLAHRDVRDDLLEALERSVGRMFGRDEETRRTTPDYARIVDARHFERLEALLAEAVGGGGRIALGGRTEKPERFMEPTVVVDPPPHAALMSEEIFGPILPVVTVGGLDEAAEIILSGDPPLSSYVFGADADLAREFSRRIRTGAVCFNETLLHFVNPYSGFGGFAESGIGRCHGHDGFLSFSNRQTVLERRWGGDMLKKLYPPYSDRTRGWLRRLLRLS